LPRPLNYTPPVYPPEAAKAGLEATVSLQLDIDRQGHVKNAAVIEPAGHGFDEAAIEAAKKLEFEPARKADGTPIPVRFLYRYSFTLKKAEPAPLQGDAPSQTEKASEALRGFVLASGGDVALPGATVIISGAAGQSEVSLANIASLSPRPAMTRSLSRNRSSRARRSR
jgi:TonB family protein